MARIYFHLVSQHETILDTVGLEVTDLDEAHAEARKAIEEFKSESPLPGAERYGWWLDAGNHAGAVVFSIPLDHVYH
jgi:hypothetical protein